MSTRRQPSRMDIDGATEMTCWRSVHSSMNEIAALKDYSEEMMRANKYLVQFQNEYGVPERTAAEIKPIRSKLKNTVNELKNASLREVEAYDKTLKHLSQLVLMKSSADNQAVEKRPKRTRTSPPVASVPGIAASVPQPVPAGIPISNLGNPPLASTASSIAAGISITLPPRATSVVAPPKAILAAGRKVAFRLPSGKSGGSGGGHGGTAGSGGGGGKGGSHEPSSEEWILAVIKKMHQNNRITVQDGDVEPEGGGPLPTYQTTSRSLIPLPDPGAPLGHPSHPNSYPEYPRGVFVLALYPDTTSFYKAEVVSTPRDTVGRHTDGTFGQYELRFEDDDETIKVVAPELVVGHPDPQ